MAADSGTSNGVHAGEFPWDLRSPDDAPLIPEPELSFAQRIADKTTIVLGSWMFIFIQLVVVAIWILLNMVAFMQNCNVPRQANQAMQSNTGISDLLNN